MVNPTKTEAIRNFLIAKTHPDLATLYNEGREVQVNVAQDDGEKIEGTYQGRNWRGWTDGITTWKPFRIPFNANSEPTYTDHEITFDLARHAEGIGMTGWDFRQRISLWVAYDFDAIVGHSDKHSKKLTEDELNKIIDLLKGIEWVTLRKSTGGKGLHLYVFLEPVTCNNHTEHAALARAILSKLSALCGYDFSTKVDVCGSNMWVWHRKMEGTDGLQLIKSGTKLKDIPPNWRDHIQVTRGRRKRNMPQFVEETTGDLFDELTSQRTKTQLDSDHKKLIEWLTQAGAVWWWDADHHMMVTHTTHLKDAHESMKLKGPFDTIAKGTEKGIDHNCYAFPLRGGGWSVRRYTPGCEEAPTWFQDRAGWTTCYLNRLPEIEIAARTNSGIEHAKGWYEYQHLKQVIKTVADLGATELKIPESVAHRRARLKPRKDGKVVVEFDADNMDRADELGGWINEKGKWTKVVTIGTNLYGDSENTVNLDDVIRHLITPDGDDSGWLLRAESTWRNEPLVHVKTALASLGYTPKEVTSIVGGGVFKAWTLVNVPFGPEYPGNREWNRNSAQLAYTPKPEAENLNFPTWLKIFNHLGKNLDDYIKNNDWCKQAGIFTGADYLMCWVASLLKEPMESLPYLFFYGDQKSGKSSFHEAIGLLMTKGVIRADTALTSQSGFNGELESSVLCVVEETNLKRHKEAANRIKDWVTSRTMLIHRKQCQPYTVRNSTHWVQCSNDHLSCPIFQGDTRITVIRVDRIDEKDIMQRKAMEDELKKEAEDFLTHVLAIDLPAPIDRLNIPVIETDEKAQAAEANLTHLQAFIKDKAFYCPGHSMEFAEVYSRFQEYLDPNLHHEWSKRRVSAEFPAQFCKGVVTGNILTVGNISFDPDAKPKPFKFIVVNGRLQSQQGNNDLSNR